MAATFTHSFDTPAFTGAVSFHTTLFIDGDWVEPMETTAKNQIINPTTQEVIASISMGDAMDVGRAVAAARKAFETTWGLHCPGAERGRYLNKLADIVEKQEKALAALESLNVGKPYDTARDMDVAMTVNVLRYYAGWADKVQGKTMETNETQLAYTRHEPYGVVGQIIPWSYPLLMAAFKIAPAVATGNTVVLKPHEMTPMTTLKLAEFIQSAGFPPGVVNIVNGYGNTVGDAIARNPTIAKVAFTGTTETGRSIMRASSDSNLKPVTLELGGRSPTVVFDDADIDEAAEWAARACFQNAGQSCIAGSRILVQRGVYDDFLAKLTEHAKALEQASGDPFLKETQQGPLISKRHYDRVMTYIEAGRRAGATVHTGGEARKGTAAGGTYVKPTIFTNVSPDMKIAQEEIFGPVAVVLRFKDEDEAVNAANATQYGLSANVFSNNIGRSIRVAHRLEAGSVWVNAAQSVHAGVPFGGYKQSGIGREMGEYALNTYTQVKALHVGIRGIGK
ncbi:putative aldehyde dehydrogenase family protein [Lyophyllum shimeji]|uniref:Aldehyde dehydrogenase family protein n=1 Tax=Lyophyllum shimeji TaxID=47721 RepID=A0A9P3UUK6_LYOSH|nr:putative aldehyde dehydrogenase family protein [Lyophyllum shimeji]